MYAGFDLLFFKAKFKSFILYVHFERKNKPIFLACLFSSSFCIENYVNNGDYTKDVSTALNSESNGLALLVFF